MAPEELQRQLMSSLSVYNRNRVTILQRAFDEGGAERVDALEREYETLRDGYFELVRRQLDRNHDRYTSLSEATASAIEEIGETAAGQANTRELLDTMAGAINLIGRMLIVLTV